MFVHNLPTIWAFWWIVINVCTFIPIHINFIISFEFLICEYLYWIFLMLDIFVRLVIWAWRVIIMMLRFMRKWRSFWFVFGTVFVRTELLIRLLRSLVILKRREVLRRLIFNSIFKSREGFKWISPDKACYLPFVFQITKHSNYYH